MTDGTPFVTSPAPTLGWGRLDRLEEFKKLLDANPENKFRIANFQGKDERWLSIIRVPIALPKYRIANGRTASGQLEYAATHNLRSDYFDGPTTDSESDAIQKAQHEILKRMIDGEGLRDRFEKEGDKQAEPVILDEHGFVVNGNRRLCCWRELYKQNPAKFSHFGRVEVIVLPAAQEREIVELEAALQIERDIREDYIWHTQANMILKNQKRLAVSTDVLYQVMYKNKMSKRELDRLIAMRELASEYLESRGKPNEWSLVDDGKYAFDRLFDAENSVSTLGEKELIRHLSFALIDDAGATGDRLYQVIPKVKAHFKAVKQKLAEEFPIPQTTSDVAELFGTTSTKVTAPINDIALAAEIRKDPEAIKKARDVLVETIENEDERKRESGKADFLLKELKRANTIIMNAAAHGLKPESTKAGVSEQLDSIQRQHDLIRDWIDEEEAKAIAQD